MLPDRTIFDETHREFRRSARRFLARAMIPNIEEWTKNGVVPSEFWLECGKQGLLSPTVPEAYGGVGADYLYNAIIVEEAAYTGFTGWGVGVHSDIVTDYISHYGSEAQKRKWLPKFVEGSVIGAIALTEPGTGSDLRGIQTTAVEDRDSIRINGAKTFISNGQTADLVIVFAKTMANKENRGFSLYLVEADRPGFSRGRNLEKLGMRAQDTSELFFENVSVPKENVLGVRGKGLSYLMMSLPQERLSIALLAMASSQKAFDITVEYVNQRKAFGRRIADFQNTRFKLAEMKTDLYAGWAFLDQCLTKHVAKCLKPTEAGMLKLWTTNMQAKVVDECLQLHGGYGYMSEYEISRLYADARVQRIYGGTSEIMKELIGREIVAADSTISRLSE